MQYESILAYEADHISIAFYDLKRQINELSDVILNNIGCGFEKPPGDNGEVSFEHHKLVSKSWFLRVSYPNKKRFIISLIKDVESAWTLSLILKSIWNCHPKGSVPSPFEAWSTYDQVPMDHNRSALPRMLLTEVMEVERKWFRTLEPYQQAEFLIELLKCAGGPIVWAVYNKAQTIFNTYQEEYLQSIEECNVVGEPQAKDKSDKTKKDVQSKPPSKLLILPESAEARREILITHWNSIINSMRDSYKLEQVELSFNDGTKKIMWKVKGPKLEIAETVDFLQLLPLSVAKRILYFVPGHQLNECARVNKYWSFMVDELKAELAARDKIDLQIKKMKELLQPPETEQGSTTCPNPETSASYSIHHPPHPEPSATTEPPQVQKSPMTHAQLARRQLNAGKRPMKCPVRNMAELSGKLNRRGAADDNLWVWCKRVLEMHKRPNILKNTVLSASDYSLPLDGVMPFENMHFPCPLMTEGFEVPTKQVITKDVTVDRSMKKKKDVQH